MMPSILDGGSMRRLMAYSTAAGVGAFTFSPGAQAAVQINNSVNGSHDVHAVTDIFRVLDVDGNGIDDVRFLTGDSSIIVLPAIGSPTTIFANFPSGHATYYVLGFQPGNTVNSSFNYVHPSTLGFTFQTFNFGNPVTNPVNPGYYIYYHHTADGDWVGLSFDINGSTHFGAIEILQQSGHRPTPNGIATPEENLANPDPINVTFGRMIWEDQPDTPLVVIPEPTSLALLAVGAGAVGLRRRREPRVRGTS